jgi:DNA (cytosine-5)-methyltransferase 1
MSGRESSDGEENDPLLKGRGTDKPWYQGRDLSEAARQVFRERSRASGAAKRRATNGEGPEPIHGINKPLLDPHKLMPLVKPHGLRSLSLFSGGGGFDVGFDRAGFEHVASYEIIDKAAETLRKNRPSWQVFGGADGDVRKVDWRQYRGKVDVLHGGPPCQPFSNAGRQLGEDDVRDMWPEFVRAVLEVEPAAFVGENVSALKGEKFVPYVESTILGPLSHKYKVVMFEIRAESLGVPQTRRRVIFVGFRTKKAAAKYRKPDPTHRSLGELPPSQRDLFDVDLESLPRCMGVREALGLADIGFDALAPTMRSGFTGPRHTTSVLSSVSALRIWNQLRIWPNGVAKTREAASVFVPENGHFRLSVADCALIQGFPESWPFHGAVYVALGQLGNAVAPPMGYALAASVARTLL